MSPNPQGTSLWLRLMHDCCRPARKPNRGSTFHDWRNEVGRKVGGKEADGLAPVCAGTAFCLPCLLANGISRLPLKSAEQHHRSLSSRIPGSALARPPSSGDHLPVLKPRKARALRDYFFAIPRGQQRNSGGSLLHSGSLNYSELQYCYPKCAVGHLPGPNRAAEVKSDRDLPQLRFALAARCVSFSPLTCFCLVHYHVWLQSRGPLRIVCLLWITAHCVPDAQGSANSTETPRKSICLGASQRSLPSCIRKSICQLSLYSVFRP